MKGIAFEKEGRDRVEMMSPLVGTFLIGPFYFLICKAYVPAGIYFLISLFTAGIGWLILPFFAELILRGYYQSRGWVEVEYLGRARHENGLDWRDMVNLALGGGILIAITGIVVLMYL